jgi:polysaccharide export outer membrane protein
MLSGKRVVVCLCLALGGFTALALAVPFACAQSAMETQQQANERIRSLSASTVAPPHDYVIGRGDLVSVEVYDVPELTRDVRVSQTGTIGLPLVPLRLYVAGLTEMQVQQKVAEVLEADGLISHPQVMVSVKEKKSKPITIVGAVARPMVYQADRPVTLIQVLAEAGGISIDAGDTVIITRGGEPPENANSNEPPEIGNEDAVTAPASPPSANAPPVAEQKSETPGTKTSSVEAPTPSPALQAKAQSTTPNSAATPPPITASDEAPLPNTITVNLTELLERGDTQNNIPLQSGDVVTVPHAGIVYAFGAVQRPGGFVSNNDRAQLSALKLLALAGGFTRIAKKDHAVIIRKDATGKQQSIPVDLGKIVNQKTEDVRLLPSDILYIPDNITKAALLRAAEIGLGVGTAVAIYRIGSR